MSTDDIWKLANARLTGRWSCAIELPGHVIVGLDGRELGLLTPTRGGHLEAIAFTAADPHDNPSRFFSEGDDGACFDAALVWLEASRSAG